MRLLVARHGKSLKRINKKGFPEILGGSYNHDAPLSNMGFEQAKEMGRGLPIRAAAPHNGKAGIAAFYSSALQRAKSTAAVCADIYEYGGIPQDDPLLNERFFGGMSGMFCDEAVLHDEAIKYMDNERIERLLGVQNTFGSFKEYLGHVIYGETPNVHATTIVTINSEFPAFGVETVDDVTERIARFEEKLLQKHREETAAVFCHGDVMRCWLAKIAAEPERYAPKTVQMAQEMPPKGMYRDVPNASLIEIVLS